jgi:hypothetical protein
MCCLQTGQLNEYSERKEMSCDVVCMALGRVPPGEQRSRFLAVGLADDTVRIVSLDPNVSSSDRARNKMACSHVSQELRVFVRNVCVFSLL